MPQNALWSGTPSIKGYTEFQQMALLTFSLVGLQYVWCVHGLACTFDSMQPTIDQFRVADMDVFVAVDLPGVLR